MSYKQYMAHWRNHSKAKYVQQCSPLIQNSPGTKKNFEIQIGNGIYIVTAYNETEARERLIAELGAIERS